MGNAPQPAGGEVEDLAAFLAATGVAASASILDVPCGIGRRAHALAERGFRVTAVDSNEVAIEAIRRRATKELEGRLVCRFAARDTIPGAPVSETFEVILCLDHALGRDAFEDDGAFLLRLRGHLAKDGFLLMDFLQRDFFASRPRPFAYHVLGDVEQHEFRRFDPVSGILDLRWRFYGRDGKDLRFRGESAARMKLMTPDEIQRLLERAGWQTEGFFGGWNREAVSADRRKLVVLARPSARS